MGAASFMWRSAAAAVISGAASIFGVSGAAAAGPFDGLDGVWTGNGTLTYASGTKEPLSCRVQYLQPTATTLTQALRCASDSYNFQINANFSSTNGRLTTMAEAARPPFDCMKRKSPAKPRPCNAASNRLI